MHPQTSGAHQSAPDTQIYSIISFICRWHTTAVLKPSRLPQAIPSNIQRSFLTGNSKQHASNIHSANQHGHTHFTATSCHAFLTGNITHRPPQATCFHSNAIALRLIVSSSVQKLTDVGSTVILQNCHTADKLPRLQSCRPRHCLIKSSLVESRYLTVQLSRFIQLLTAGVMN